jgi:hypothetical protein
MKVIKYSLVIFSCTGDSSTGSNNKPTIDRNKEKILEEKKKN